MAPNRQRGRTPSPRAGARASKRLPMMRQLQAWFRRCPALGIAYEQVCQRFGGSPGVCGIGVGRKFSEATGEYLAAPASTGGLCVKIFVTKKKEVRGKYRIPARLDVSVPGTSARQRVLLDVVSMGAKSRKAKSGGLQQGWGWPHAGCISPGRRFTFGKRDTAQMNGQQFERNDAVLGTTGAAIRFADNSRFGISAGHVFTDIGAANPCRPQGVRALGVKGQEWKEVQGSEFRPLTIRTAEWIRDLMLFPIPDTFCPSPDATIWPDGFLQEMATQADIERAVLAKEATGFIWVDRKGPQPEEIPVDLEAGCPRLSLAVDCGDTTKSLTFIMVWPLRLLPGRHTTELGDSGSPVFLRTTNNTNCRLLGMHVLQLGGHAYAMDAGSFFSQVLHGKLNKNVWFM
jgi:hypothetical protein